MRRMSSQIVVALQVISRVAAATICALLALAIGASSALAATATPVFRFYNTQKGTHFYTSSAAERDSVIAKYSWFSFEGTAFYGFDAKQDDSLPVFRFYNNLTGTHFYTISTGERDYVLANFPAMLFEGPAFYAPPTGGDARTPLYRFYNTRTNSHFYTTSAAERDHVLATWPSFTFEQVAFNVFTTPTPPAGSANAQPTGTLSSSMMQVNVPGSTTLTVDAKDPDGSVAKVEFYAGLNKFAEKTTAPFTATFNFTSSGDQQFSAIVYDNRGASASSNLITVKAGTGAPIANVGPTVTLSASSTSIGVPGTTTLSAAAADADGTVAKVAFFQGGTKVAEVAAPPYSYVFNTSTAGTYSFAATAYDNLGATGSSNSVSVVASATPAPPVTPTPDPVNVPPTVSVGLSNAVITIPGAVTVTITARDSDGTISRVTLNMNGAKVADLTQSPYTYTANLTTPGTYSFSADAVDNKGASTTSVAQSVVANAAPPIVAASADAWRLLNQATFGARRQNSRACRA